MNFPAAIKDLHIADIKNPSHPSIFYHEEGYEVLITGLPAMIEDRVAIKIFTFLFIGNESYRFIHDDGELSKNSSRFGEVYKLLDEQIDLLMEQIGLYEDRIDQAEETLYGRTSKKDLNEVIFFLKRDLSKVERLSSRAFVHLKGMVDFYMDDPDFLKHEFMDVLEHLERVVRNSQAFLKRLDHLYKFHQTVVDAKDNKTMFILTVVSAFFLPMNFIVGFFGMNTKDLPFLASHHGTFYVAGIIGMVVVITLILWLIFKKRLLH
jgi:magnesium transporter